MRLIDMENMPLDLLDRKNWSAENYWFAVREFRAFWDRYLKLWTVFVVDHNENQIEDCEYFNNRDDYKNVAVKWSEDNTEKLA
jgi:hypothetical protein